jgi:hypothetical protein
MALPGHGASVRRLVASGPDLWAAGTHQRGRSRGDGAELLLRWTGARWAPEGPRGRNGVVQDVARDGRGGLWLIEGDAGALAHWPDHGHAASPPAGPVPYVAALAAVPGSRTVWAAGSVAAIGAGPLIERTR